MGDETLQFVLPLLVIMLIAGFAVGCGILAGYIFGVLDRCEARKYAADLRRNQLRVELLANVQTEAEKRGLALSTEWVASIAETELERLWQYHPELFEQNAPKHRRHRSFSVGRFLDLLGLLFPPKTRERIYTAYAEELKEDHSAACKRYRTKGARCWVRFSTGVKICLLLVFCIPTGILEKLSSRTRNLILAILEGLYSRR